MPLILSNKGFIFFVQDNWCMLSHSLILFNSLLTRNSAVSFVSFEGSICMELEGAFVYVLMVFFLY